MLMPEIKDVDKSGRLSILHRKTLKMDYTNVNKRDNDIFNLGTRISHKNIDKQQVEKNVESKLRVIKFLNQDTSPYFFGQKNASFYPSHLKSQVSIGRTDLNKSISCFQRNTDKPNNINSDYIFNINTVEKKRLDFESENKSRNNTEVINKVNKIKLDENKLNISVDGKNEKKNLLNQFHNYESAVSRGKKNKLVSKSFIDKREDRNEFLNQSNDKDNSVLHGENEYRLYDRAKKKIKENEKTFNDKLKNFINKPKIKNIMYKFFLI